MFRNYADTHYEKYFSSDCLAASIPSFLTELLCSKRILNLYDYCTTKCHIALLVRRGKILAFAHNKEGSRNASTKGSGTYVHAEKNLLLSIRGNYKLLKNSSIYIGRIGPSNTNEIEFRYSQPCPECTVLLNKCIKAYGLKQVFFTM